MKILAPYAYFAPEQAASSYLWQNLHEDYAKAGMDCVVYVPTPTRDISVETRKEYKENYALEKKYDDKLTIHRFSLYGECKNPLLRALRYLLSCGIQFCKCMWAKDAKDCDVMFIASTPPILGLVGAYVSKFRGIPFVYNLQDIFPDSLVNNGLTKEGSLLWKIGRVIENFTYKHADKIIVISEDFKKNIMAKGVPEEKIVVVYNWVDQNAVVDIPREKNKLFDAYGLDRSKFYVTYNGNIGLSQNMDMLLSVAGEFKLRGESLELRGESLELRGENLELRGESLELRGESLEMRDERLEMRGENFTDEEKKELVMCKDIQFVLVGNGAYLDEVKRIVAEKNLDNVHLLPFQPYEDISHVFSLGDVSLVISKPGTGAASVPSKTWSIMSASRPVLANFDENEIKCILEGESLELRGERKPCGIFTKAGDKEAFKAAIISLYENRDKAVEMGKNGRQFVMDNLTREVGTQKYVNVIKDVVGKA